MTSALTPFLKEICTLIGSSADDQVEATCGGRYQTRAEAKEALQGLKVHIIKRYSLEESRIQKVFERIIEDIPPLSPTDLPSDIVTRTIKSLHTFIDENYEKSPLLMAYKRVYMNIPTRPPAFHVINPIFNLCSKTDPTFIFKSFGFYSEEIRDFDELTRMTIKILPEEEQERCAENNSIVQAVKVQQILLILLAEEDYEIPKFSGPYGERVKNFLEYAKDKTDLGECCEQIVKSEEQFQELLNMAHLAETIRDSLSQEQQEDLAGGITVARAAKIFQRYVLNRYKAALSS